MSDPTGTPPPAGAPAPTTALAKSGERFPRPLIDCFRRGDMNGMFALLGLDKLEGPTALAVRTIAELAVETRRENVAVLGSHEAFVRHTRGGSLHQVIMPVRLSLADKTLYQIPIRKPHDPFTLEPIANLGWWHAENDKKGVNKKKPIWKDQVQTSAEVAYQGFLRLNGVAGCAVAQPPEVMVDGTARTNPYVQRLERADGRLGDIMRVVIGIAVVGPTPATGNPVVVNYTLDYDPAKDLQHMLGKIAEEHKDECYLVDEEDVEKKPGWKFVPLYGGVGYYVNLRLTRVQEAYSDFTNILQNAVKKAQTIARRNAMKSHPALAFHTVEVDAHGRAVVAVVGWAGDQSAMDRWTGLVSRLSRGQTIDVESVTVEETYDAEAHRAGEADGVDVAGSTTELEPEVSELNRLIDQIDNAMPHLTHAQLSSLNYNPAKMTIEDLRAVLGKVNDFLDKPKK